jgi:hypothetical protein
MAFPSTEVVANSGRMPYTSSARFYGCKASFHPSDKPGIRTAKAATLAVFI